VGKTTVLQLAALCAFKKGLNTALSAVMAERATQLGGVHLNKLFSIPVKRRSNPI
jgi:hypothetical protein